MPVLARRLNPLLRRWYARWIRLTGGSRVRVAGDGHHIHWNDARLRRCEVRISGTGNRLEFGAGAMLWGAHIELRGHNLVCRLGAGLRVRGGTFILTDDHSRLEIGADTTMTGPTLVAQGGRRLSLGRDCMVAYGADLRCSDGHSVVDLASGENLNPAADVRVGDHVWIGIHSQVLKGVEIADHSIVAARSVVTRSVPGASIVAGNPARVIRTGITWDRRRPLATTPLPDVSPLT